MAEDDSMGTGIVRAAGKWMRWRKGKEGGREAGREGGREVETNDASSRLGGFK